MELNKFIGTKIKKFRESRNMTQDELAELLDTTRPSISCRAILGESVQSRFTIFQLYQVFV